MKLLFISADFPPTQSAEAAHAYHLALQLARRGAQVHVLTSVTSEPSKYPNLTVHPLMRSWSWTSLPRFVAFLKHCAPDAVFLMFLGTMYGHEPMMTFSASISKRFVPSATFVTQFEGFYILTPRPWSRVIRKAVATWVTGHNTSYAYGTLLRESDQIVVLSDKHRAALVSEFPPVNQKCLLMPPPPIMTIVPDNEGRARLRGRHQLGVGPDEFLLVYYGYIYPGKGVETLMRALHIVSNGQRRIRLAIVGGPVTHAVANDMNGISQRYMQECKVVPERLGIADRIIWAGLCPPDTEEGSTYLWAADACVLPFDNGVYLNNSSFAAAISHALPVITTRGALLEQPFNHGDNVYLCPPKDPAAMAAAIAMLADKPDVCHRLRTGARILAAEWFAWEKVVDRTLHALRPRP